MRIIQSQDIFFESDFMPKVPWSDEMVWPASWISCYVEEDIKFPFVTAYRLQFSLKETETVTLHVSADERYELFMDGKRLGRGPERSDTLHWCYETYEVALDAGHHVISSKVWSVGEWAPGAQMSVRHGFLLTAEGRSEFSTGTASWESKEIPGISFQDHNASWAEKDTGLRNIIDFSKYPDGAEYGNGDGWHSVVVGEAAHCQSSAGHLSSIPYLYPAMLPPMLNNKVHIGKVKVVNPAIFPQMATIAENDVDMTDSFQQLLDSDVAVEIPAGRELWVLIDLEDYYCLYPEICLSGGKGASVSIDLSESLSTESESAHTIPKGNRSEFDGKYWVEFHGDTFIASGEKSRTASPVWFRTGRWMALNIKTAGEALTIEYLHLSETRYPLEQRSNFKTSDSSFEEIEPIMLRTLQMCAHETYFDCPYYEQKMYIGDTRLQALITYVINGDSRLPRKALRLFDWSRSYRGLTASCHPNRYRQTIPTFSLIWIGMLHDHAMWTMAGDAIISMLPTMRSIIEYWESFRQEDGLIAAPPGWNFVDWSRPEGVGTFLDDLPRWGEFTANGITGVKWDIGTPPDGYQGGVSGVLNLFYLYFLGFAIELEEQFGEVELTARLKRLQKESFDITHKTFYSKEHKLYADNLDHSIFSEHSQCLALLSGLPDEEITAAISESLFSPKILLAETTYYFSHYYFETCRITGRIDKLLERQEQWQHFTELGLKTVLEEPEPSRSDCHAWGSHPLFHWYSTILGVRPAEFGCGRLIIKPQLGALEYAEGKIPFGDEFLSIRVEQHGESLAGTIVMPSHLAGTLDVNEELLELVPGEEYKF